MPKHIPLRSCAACRENTAKRRLVRVVRAGDDHVEIDRTGKQNGRGAYLCPAVECWELARKKRALERSLSVAIPPENWDVLMTYARDTLPEKKVPPKTPVGAAETR